ncbi:hypothetical protein D6T63_18180 [Arthrobacter cheniae]|uniref:HPt domain-containing protein n=1 Tax=Arthrobacter cheniae TaxID=1258888 RepID=A0A3A5LWZ4_9MICC|nr:hypothetical protein [Arthrobacter cheniae]RJT75115.1 hypothetical protein D6T63_18180 [Arthrobacter cheniae]
MIPALDAFAFEILAEDLGTDDASDFLTSFEALLTGRIQRIERALQAQDEEAITEALLSLQASAAMAGAAQLQASATHALMQQPMRSTPPGPLVRKLQGQADMFKDALVTFHHIGYSPITHMHMPPRSKLS